MHGELLKSPLVSIVITNYNYGRFLREAVDSAINQTYSNTEVVVVDDGSTDNSRDIVADYEDQITLVLKENGGQSSACNAGIRASKGEIVTFLDADDVYLPGTVGSVVAAFQANPSAVMVQYRMQVIDASGNPTSEVSPPSYLLMPSGDLRPHILKHHRYIWPGGSAMAFAAATLRQVLPIPESIYRGTPDIYLCNLIAVLGPIISLDEVGALYRVHGRNNFHAATLDIAQLRRTLVAFADSHAKQKHLFNTLYSANVREIGSRDHPFLVFRVVSLKLDPLNHPFKDSLLSLCTRGCILSITSSDPLASRGLAMRLLWSLWFVVMLFAPKAFAEFLAEKTLIPESRGWLNHRFLSLVRKVRLRR